MQIYLPIAEISLNLWLLLGLGLGVGFLSGLFGVGGGFLMTPILIFLGIPPAVAVSTQANQIVASSVSGALAHFRRKTLDVKMGLVLLAGGIVGSVSGVQLFGLLQRLGQIDLVISLCYVGFLGVIGSLMLFESVNAIRRRRSAGGPVRPKRRKRGLIDTLPFKTRFAVSGLYMSVIPPIAIGFLVGVLAALMGVGGGFVMVPAMIYLLRMPTNVVIGTSLFQILFVASLTSFLQAVQNQTVDMVLAGILIVGGVVGAQIGARFTSKIPAEELRALLALMVVSVCLKLLWDLTSTPVDMFVLMQARGGM
ncbi:MULTISPECIES: sulfite exporter TauE/SafE family protein [Oceanicaulis]|uniref:sulfite exporter TauE/SafE family protein n=1 Tax=Oceanicaulis TaxID=153232 RepID=UPI0003B3D8B1|nr:MULTISPECIES: sulfite exporter TauE/SafE family protein [Oceanicaulis]MBL4539530.1 sulfite exporter TauE/SafE family protein [Oceanicaulis sp.]VXC77144.1 putative membrane transporter protein [Oceanicaulis sp. 350]HCR65097.1 sulfite exporter TauE/SafE family protein [Oceanicaulis sp.]